MRVLCFALFMVTAVHAGVGDLYRDEQGGGGNFSQIRSGDSAGASNVQPQNLGSPRSSLPTPRAQSETRSPEASTTSSAATASELSTAAPPSAATTAAREPVAAASSTTGSAIGDKPKGFSLYMTRLGNAMGCFTVFLKQMMQLRAQNVDTNVACSSSGDSTCEKTKEILKSNNESQNGFYQCLDTPSGVHLN